MHANCSKTFKQYKGNKIMSWPLLPFSLSLASFYSTLWASRLIWTHTYTCSSVICGRFVPGSPTVDHKIGGCTSPLYKMAYRHTFFYCALTYCTWQNFHSFVFCKWKVCGNPAFSKSLGDLFPTAFVHFMSLSCFGNSSSISNFRIFVSVVCDQCCLILLLQKDYNLKVQMSNEILLLLSFRLCWVFGAAWTFL